MRLKIIWIIIDFTSLDYPTVGHIVLLNKYIIKENLPGERKIGLFEILPNYLQRRTLRIHFTDINCFIGLHNILFVYQQA